MSLRNIYYSLSPGMRLFARRAYYFPIDLFNSIARKRHRYEPPKGKIFIGSGDFIKQGQLQLHLLKEHTSLHENHDVLDIGSGMGRTAAALTTFLSQKGSYNGFDIMKNAVQWCNKRIGLDFPNFHFTHAPLGNDLYNSNKTAGEMFRFPYDDNSFDVSFLFSVFSYRLMNEKIKSANVAYLKNYLESIISKAGLVNEKEIQGFWRGDKTGHNDFQDIIVLKKPIQ